MVFKENTAGCLLQPDGDASNMSHWSGCDSASCKNEFLTSGADGKTCAHSTFQRGCRAADARRP
jgi:hypothetical protein